MQVTPVTAKEMDTAVAVTQAQTKDQAEVGGLQEKIKGFHSLLNALEEVTKHPNSVSKHNEARSIIRNTTLGEYYSRDQSTECLFAVAERVDEGES